MAEVIFENVSTLTGTYPEILVSETLLAELGEDDPDPVFITVPVGEVDASSRNGRNYNRAAVQSIVDAINDATIGQRGHLRDEERAYKFEVPPLVWVGATLESDGRAWGKAYVMQSAADVREYVKVAKRTGLKIGTSIYGTADIDEEGNVSNLEIESIDLAHPARLGVPQVGATPHVTRETADETPDPGQQPSEETLEEITPMGDKPTQETTEPGSFTKAQVIEIEGGYKKRIRELEDKLAEQTADLRDYKHVADNLGNPEDVIGELRNRLRLIEALERENRTLLDGYISAQVAEKVKLEDMRPVIVEQINTFEPASRAEVDTAVSKVLERDSVKRLLALSVSEAMGPKQTRPVTPQSDDPHKNVEGVY